MTKNTNVPSVLCTDKMNSCQSITTSDDVRQTSDTKVFGIRPSFENGYVTMAEDGLAIAMVPKAAE